MSVDDHTTKMLLKTFRTIYKNTNSIKQSLVHPMNTTQILLEQYIRTQNFIKQSLVYPMEKEIAQTHGYHTCPMYG